MKWGSAAHSFPGKTQECFEHIDNLPVAKQDGWVISNLSMSVCTLSLQQNKDLEKTEAKLNCLTVYLLERDKMWLCFLPSCREHFHLKSNQSGTSESWKRKAWFSSGLWGGIEVNEIRQIYTLWEQGHWVTSSACVQLCHGKLFCTLWRSSKRGLLCHLPCQMMNVPITYWDTQINPVWLIQTFPNVI